jgi:hypothetical protein
MPFFGQIIKVTDRRGFSQISQQSLACTSTENDSNTSIIAVRDVNEDKKTGEDSRVRSVEINGFPPILHECRYVLSPTNSCLNANLRNWDNYFDSISDCEQISHKGQKMPGLRSAIKEKDSISRIQQDPGILDARLETLLNPLGRREARVFTRSARTASPHLSRSHLSFASLRHLILRWIFSEWSHTIWMRSR